MPDALNAGVRIDDVNRIAFRDRLGGALRQTRTARNAVFGNFHHHGLLLLFVNEILLTKIYLSVIHSLWSVN